MIARLRRWLGLRRKGDLVAPPTLRISEYLEQFPGRWDVTRPPAPLDWVPPRSVGSRTLDYERELHRVSSEFGVLELEGGRVLGSHGWVIGVNGAVLPELSWYEGPSERIRVPRTLPPALELEGACLSLVSDWSCRNYAHFLLDGLGRLAVFRDAGSSLSDVDHVYCPTPPSPVAGHLLDRLGIPPEKRVWAGREVLVCADRLIVPSRPATGLAYPPWLIRFLRQLVLAAPATPATRRLYVSRRGFGRHAVRERELEALLLERGFEIYDPTTHPNQPEDFAEAAVVVGAHGAGLANLAFCRPGTRVIEIIPTDNAHPFYYSLAVAAELDYGYLVGRSASERPAEAFGPSPYDFAVDLRELAAALDEGGTSSQMPVRS
jgi:capsular polysaccharide biosynthesis protein